MITTAMVRVTIICSYELPAVHYREMELKVRLSTKLSSLAHKSPESDIYQGAVVKLKHGRDDAHRCNNFFLLLSDRQR